MEKPLGVYVHIPFCSSKCAYCNFNSLAGRDELMPGYQAAVLRHIGQYPTLPGGRRADSVYFGGGTPGYYGADPLIRILDALKSRVTVLSGAEVTVEANPGSVTKADLEKLRRAGFNRISLGVQCADDGILKIIGRTHTFADAAAAVGDAKHAGFENISVDIIYGLPSQSMGSWKETVSKIIGLGARHISCYGLKLEENTPLYRAVFSAGTPPPLPDDDAQADMYLYAVKAFERAGYAQYEISNFARGGCRSRHNMRYWLRGEYIGFGAGASSFLGGRRFSSVEDTEEYIARVMSNEDVDVYSEELTDSENASEYLMLGLRTARGISEDEYLELRGSSGAEFSRVSRLLTGYMEKGWARLADGRWSFTPEGFLLSNILIGEILDARGRR